MGSGFAYGDRFVSGLPDPSPRFTGLPKYNFIGGHGDMVEVPSAGLAAAAAAAISREGPSLAVYNLGQGPLGYRQLRDFVADKLGRHRAIKAGADDILITSGSGQGLDLVNRLLLTKGDTVLVEEFSYSGAINKIRRLGVNIVAVPLDREGIRIDSLEAILADLRGRQITPRYFYTIPTIQNPTGSVLSLARRQQLIALARRFGMPIFEDECYADLVWSGGASPPALYALDPERVIHIGSFSKTLAPALRVGYAVADWQVLSRMVACKSDGGTGALDQMIIAEYFGDHFDQHIARLTGALASKLDTLLEAVEESFGTMVEAWRPEGGIFVWLKFPDEIDASALAVSAAKRGIAFNPGQEWSCTSNGGRSFMRLCFALPSHAMIREGIAELANVSFETTGLPKRSANVSRERRS